VLDAILPRLTGNLRLVFIISVLSSLGLYTGLYKLLMYVYESYAWRFFNRGYYLAGEWRMALTKTTGSPSALFGEVSIAQTFDSIEVRARNYTDHNMTTLWSIWRSTHSWFEGGVLKLAWVVTLANGNKATGNLDLHLDQHTPPKELHGVFYDDSPSDSNGQVHLTRVQT
jgi:hypothetical protein